MYLNHKFSFLFAALLLASCTAIFAAGGDAKQDSTTYSLKYCVRQFNADSVEKTQAGYQFWFVDKNFLDGRTVKMSVVSPGMATHPPHKHAEDEFFFILEGKAEFFLAGQTKVVGPNTCLYCPSFVEHGIKNAGDTELKYLVLKKYEVK